MFRLRHLLAIVIALVAVVAAPGLMSAATAAPAKQCDKGTSKPCPYPPATPRSSVPATQTDKHSTLYCVDNYQPNSDVVVTNPNTDEKTIHTNASGHGCTNIKLHDGCQTITAHGFDQNGDPASSSASVCVEGEQFSGGSSSGGHVAEPGVSGNHNSRLPFTGSGLIVAATVLGVVLIVLGWTIVTAVRRRRALG